MFASTSKSSDKTLDFLLKYFYCLGILPKLRANDERNLFRVCYICAIFIIGASSIVIIKQYRGLNEPSGFNVLNQFGTALICFLVIFVIMRFGNCKFDETKQLFQLLRYLNHGISDKNKTDIYWYKFGLLIYYVGWFNSLMISEYFLTGTDGSHAYEVPFYYHILIGYIQMLVALMWYIWNAVRLSFLELNTKLEKQDITSYEADRLITWHATIADCVSLINDIFGWILFLITWQEFMHILNVLYFDINFNSQVASSSRYMFLWTAVVVIQGIVVAAMCEKVVDEGKKTIIISNKMLYRYLNSPAIREKLLILAHQATTRCPQFSAAGFFNVDFAMLFTFINLITTYVVVIIQFSNKT